MTCLWNTYYRRADCLHHLPDKLFSTIFFLPKLDMKEKLFKLVILIGVVAPCTNVYGLVNPASSSTFLSRLSLLGTNGIDFSRKIYSPLGAESAGKRTETCVVQRLDLSNQFERWRFLQDLLEGEVDSQDANQVLFRVLQGYMTIPPAIRKEKSFPLLDEDNIATIRSLISDTHSNCIPIFTEGFNCEVSDKYASLISDLETLLPDPVDDEDAYKGNWDTVMEIHGRESVRIDQQIGSKSWEARCTMARVLLWFEFLGEGVLQHIEPEPFS